MDRILDRHNRRRHSHRNHQVVWDVEEQMKPVAFLALFLIPLLWVCCIVDLAIWALYNVRVLATPAILVAAIWLLGKVEQWAERVTGGHSD